MASMISNPDQQRWLHLLQRTDLPEATRLAVAGGALQRIEVNQREREVHLHVQLPARLPLSEREAVGRAIAAGVGTPDARVTVYMLLPAPAPEALPDLVAAAWPEVVSQAKARIPRLNGMLDGATVAVDGNRLVMHLTKAPFKAAVEGCDAPAVLEELLQAETGWSCRVAVEAPELAPAARKAVPVKTVTEAAPEELFGDTPLPPEPAVQESQPEEPDLAKEYWMQRQSELTKQAAKAPPKAAPGTVLRGKAIAEGAPVREIKSITEDENRVIIEGDVAAVDVRELKSGRILISFVVCDLLRTQQGGLGDSLPVKCFLDAKDPKFDLKDGQWVKVRGNVQTDKFSQELTMMAEDIVLGEKPKRSDDWEGEKRAELHLHTIYSGMDGMIDAEAAVKRAVAWGHKAVAITDHGVVQGFPFAAHVKAPEDFKLIFGCELYLVDDGTVIISRAPQGVPLAEAEFVVLDIETTGFSPIGDDIIELGAVRYKNGEIGESFQSFVKPGKPIPERVQEITHITPDMVADAPAPADALRRFFAFVGDAIIVAHNASFDYSFLRYHRQRFLSEPFDNPVLDTLTLGRAMLPSMKSHSLAALTKELEVVLVDHHRADADARTAAMVLDKLLQRATKQHSDLTEVEHINRLLKAMNVQQLRPYHCTVLVRRQPGIKALYKLVSKSHLEYFNRTPRVPRTELEQARGDLLVGSGCDGGALYEALLRGVPDPELEDLIGFYDYLEVVPPANLQHLLDEGQVNSPEQLQELSRRIIELGRRLGKPVVAVSDAHFLDPHQQLFRRILKGGIGFRDEHDTPLYLRSTAEMMAEFAFLGEELAREIVIEAPHVVTGLIDTGIYPVPNQLFTPKLEGAEENTRSMTYEKAKRFYGDSLPELVEQRIERELNSIIGNGFAVIYYIAHLLVKKSNELGYLVGSRGSVGSSFVAWCLGITEVNALPPHYLCTECHHIEWYADGTVGSGFDLPDKACPNCGQQLLKDGQDIPFETFLGFKGDKVPDIDLNFSGEVQNRIQKFSEELLGGEKQVFKAGTIGTIADKTAFGMVKGWLEDNNIAGVRSAHVEYLAKGVAGVKRTTGQHPGGMVVVPVGMEVEEVTPVQYPADDRESGVRTTHFDFHSFDSALLKLDILGHDDPTSLRMLQDLTGIDVTTIAMNDERVLRLFAQGGSDALGLKPGEVEYDLGTIAVPEFGTGFVRRMLLETKPRTFSDLVRISGLSHGTDVWTNNAQELIKKGTCTLQTVIPTRDDIMVRLMYWGLEPSKAFKIMESVRKGKGLTDEMEADMKAKGVPDWYIWSCKQIKYMFPKAHAAAYVMSSVRVAFFKVYHPREYYATYFTVRAGSFDADLICKGPQAVQGYMAEIAAKGRDATAKEKDALTEMELVMEAFKRGINFRKVDLWRSDAVRFTIDEDGALLCPFNALAGLGENAARAIVEARGQGEFQSVEDLRNRARLNKTVIELMQNHGCFKGLPENNQLVFNF